MAKTNRQFSLLFACLVALFCAWALTLPLFPTQDGPMHKYYVHAIASLLSGSHGYDEYLIRRPFPPYATHYAVLLGLAHFVSYDVAEKLLIALIFICTAYGFRYCARSFGTGGSVASLCMVPLILHWSLVMGFLNYSLAVGLFFLAAGLWCRAAADQTRLWLFFAIVCALLAVTHPIPLLCLILFCASDLLIRGWQSAALGRFQLRDYRFLLTAVGIAAVCFLFPLASVDRSRSASNLHGFGLHRDALVSSLALFGLSPFDTRARSPLINAYRLGIYALLFGSIVLAATGLVSRFRQRELRTGDTMLMMSVAMLLAIPVLPASMNGSDFFAQRLMIFPWLGSLAAAGGYEMNRRLERILAALALVLIVLTLVPAERFFRPVAQQLYTLEQQPLPRGAKSLALLDPAMLKATRVQHELGFSPYLWSGALPLLHADDVMLNSPFMDQKITPLMPAPGGDLLIDQVSSPELAEKWINGNVDLQALPVEMRDKLLDSTHVLVWVAVPADVRRGLPSLIGDEAARRFSCVDQTWYLVCTR